MAKKRGDKSMDLLLENNIALQKSIMGLATEVKSLNKKVSSLLSLFEDASKAFKEARIEGEAAAPAVSEELSEKLEELIKQNKTIARGLLLLEKSLRKTRTEAGTRSKEEYKPKPLPEFSF